MVHLACPETDWCTHHSISVLQQEQISPFNATPCCTSVMRRCRTSQTFSARFVLSLPARFELKLVVPFQVDAADAVLVVVPTSCLFFSSGLRRRGVRCFKWT